MTIINQALATDVNISELLANPSINPAPKLGEISTLGGLLTSGGFNLINFIFVIIGLIFFANLIMVGWEFMMSTGDTKKIAAASTRLLNGFIGLILAVAAYIIVKLITKLLGLDNLI